MDKLRLISAAGGKVGRALGLSALWVYRAALAPYMARGACRFAPSCSEYTRQAIEARGLAIGLALGAARLARCTLWLGRGYSPAPRKANKIYE